MNQLVFLPGASGSQGFWQPLLAHLKTDQSTKILTYPGFDGVEPNSTIQNLHDLQELITEQIEDDSILVAQSMGEFLQLELHYIIHRKSKDWFYWQLLVVWIYHSSVVLTGG
ncbi:alpha/beta hydrolase [Acinetobacter variabilis]|nr:alpha/beta hydrolase [Acinetobacter variabilis]